MMKTSKGGSRGACPGICEYFGVSLLQQMERRVMTRCLIKEVIRSRNSRDSNCPYSIRLWQYYGASWCRWQLCPLTEKAVTAFQRIMVYPKLALLTIALAKLEQLYRKSIESKVSKYIQYFKLQRSLLLNNRVYLSVK